MKLFILGFISISLIVGLVLVNMRQNPGKYAQTIEDQTYQEQTIEDQPNSNQVIETESEQTMIQTIGETNNQVQENEETITSELPSPTIVSATLTTIPTQNISPEPSATPEITTANEISPTISIEPTNLITEITQPTSGAACKGDLTSDGIVDLRDLNILIEKFGSQDCSINQDADASCFINIKDYSIVIENYGCQIQ